MHYINTYGMKRNPFINTKVGDAYITEDVKELNHRLKYLQQVKGLAIIYGEHGTGKTFNVRSFMNTLSNIKYKPVYIFQTSVGRYEFYKQIAIALEIPIVCSKVDLFISIQAKIKSLSVNNQTTTVLVIDEADRLHPDVINDLELLLNWDIDASRYCILILCGKRDLINQIPNSLADRVIVQYNAKGIMQNEVKGYMAHMLAQSGCSQKVYEQLFDESAINALAQCCGNNIRKLNMLIDKCLFFGSSKQLEKIDNELIMAVYKEITIK